jgi:hypothetical protein
LTSASDPEQTYTPLRCKRNQGCQRDGHAQWFAASLGEPLRWHLRWRCSRHGGGQITKFSDPYDVTKRDKLIAAPSYLVKSYG